jgi:predicted TIM-barrel fold metal-dependent hydrolase
MPIDFHTHCLRPEHWGEEFRLHWKPVYGEDWPEVDAASFDEAMDGVVSLAVVFGIRATRAGVATPNEHTARFCRETRTPTIGFMALDPSDDDVLDQFAEGVGLGLRGIKLYPVLAQFSLEEPLVRNLLAEAEKTGMPILWHVGATPPEALPTRCRW